MNGPQPIASYRVQLSADFPFAAARNLVPYLATLGISHLYVSPIATSVAGSTHGYDVVDPTVIDPELGGREGFDALVAVLGEHGMGLLVDVVPNHMSAHESNPYWFDVLEHGRSSRWAHVFDLDPADGSGEAPPILLPVLDDHLGRVIERGGIRLVRDGCHVLVAYADRRLPLRPETVASITEPLIDHHATVGNTDIERVVRRVLDDPAHAGEIDRRLEQLTGDASALGEILDAQHFRLAYWRLANRELDYRRFFDVDSLVGVRVEEPDVFELVDRVAIAGVRSGAISGIRIDHVDGLRDPFGYLCRLRERVGDAWIVVEKILEGREHLPTTWPVDGTTGYEFATAVTRLFVHPAGASALDDLARSVTGSESWSSTLRAAKDDVLADVLTAEQDRLATALVAAAHGHLKYRDFARVDLRAAIGAVLVHLDVYRTYVDARSEPSVEDLAVLAAAVTSARVERSDIDDGVFDLLHRVLSADAEFNDADDVEFRERFQQASGALMAKAKEDTSFFRWPGLLSLEDVGGGPDIASIGADEFHRFAMDRQRLWPRALNALTTHDSKRSEDVRARLSVLSEIPELWIDQVTRWMHAHERHSAVGDAMRLYAYQTLVGAHPLSRERAGHHLLKAAREAKTSTSWLDPDPTYERALDSFVDTVFDDLEFRRELEAMVELVKGSGRSVALSQKVLQLLAPGVPDIYQGQELWDHSLTDPDNRRPVDFGTRIATLERLRLTRPSRGRDVGDGGSVKAFVTERGLAMRRQFPDAFGPDGTYEPLDVSGPARDRVVAFQRSQSVAVVVPRLAHSLDGAWHRTRVQLPPGTWIDVLDPVTTWKGKVDVRDLWQRFPVSMLVRRVRPPSTRGRA